MAIGSILVVGVAVLGSLTVLPAVLAKLGDRVHRSRLPLLRSMQARGARLPHVGLRPRPRHAPPGRRPGRRRRHPRGARPARPSACRPSRPAWTTSPGSTFPVHEDLRPHASSPSRARRSAAEVVIEATERERAPSVQGRHRRPQAARRSRPAQVLGPIGPTEISRDGTRRDASTCRSSATAPTSRTSMDALADGARASSPATVGSVPGATVDVGGDSRRRPRTANDNLVDARTARVRVRARDGVPAAAGHVPVDRDPDQGDPAQPALRRSRLRRAHARLPARLGRGHRDAAHQGHRIVAAGLPVRDPLRPLDGLPRVHPEPHQGGLGPGHGQRRPPSSRASAARPGS